MNWYLAAVVGFFMALIAQRFYVAVKNKTGDADRDHCEQTFAILLVALCVVLTR